MKKFFFLIIIIVLYSNLINAQDELKQLVITEVNTDLKDQEIWIEIYNPENVPLILNSLRISGIKTPNVLPSEYKKQKGIKIKPGERMVICSDIQKFKNKFGNNIRVVEQKLLKSVINGGFVAINNLDNVENSKKIIRLGDKEKSKIIAGLVGDNDVLDALNDEMSYSREIKKNGEISVWSKTDATPGK